MLLHSLIPSRSLCLLLVYLHIISCSYHVAVAIDHAPKLPWHPLQWRYAHGREVEPPDDAARFWDRQLLAHSIGAANYGQMKRLLDKLNAGLPITVAAVGSSVVQDHGGAFHSSIDALRAAVPSPHPQIYGGVDGSDGTPWMQTGWLTYFMRAVNDTWPHAGHMLVNAGAGGCQKRDGGRRRKELRWSIIMGDATSRNQCASALSQLAVAAECEPKGAHQLNLQERRCFVLHAKPNK